MKHAGSEALDRLEPFLEQLLPATTAKDRAILLKRLKAVSAER